MTSGDVTDAKSSSRAVGTMSGPPDAARASDDVRGGLQRPRVVMSCSRQGQQVVGTKKTDGLSLVSCVGPFVW